MRWRGAMLAVAVLVLGCHKEATMTDEVLTVKPTNGKSTRGPVSFAASAKGAVLEVEWTNNTNAAMKIVTHVFAGEKHFDYLDVQLTDSSGVTRRFVLKDNRDESAPVVVDVAPGATIGESVDLAAWAKRGVNGSQPLASGSYDAIVVYDSTHQTRAWQGRLEAATTVTVP